MIQLSDANPIHIFYEDEESFNNTTVDNIDHECYIHEHQCDEPVLEQVFDDESDDEYDWVFYDENDVEIHRIEMSLEEISAEQETDDLEDFENIGAGTLTWTIDESPSITVGSAFGLKVTKTIAPPNEFSFIPGKIYRFRYNLTTDEVIPQMKTVLMDADDNILHTTNTLVNVGTSSKFVDIVIPEGAVKFGWYFTRFTFGGEGPMTVTFNSYSVERIAFVHEVEFTASDLDYCERRLRFEVLRRSDDVLFGHTELIYFPLECKSSVLILYKSDKNFAGLIYDEYSEHRYLRVKGRFFHPGKSGSQASSEQSNGTVVTRNWTMKKKKLLEVQDCPEYMNTKIDLVLAHCVDGNLTINEVSWEFSDGDQYEYEGAADRPDTYSFQPGKAWLTRQNYFKQNTL